MFRFITYSCVDVPGLSENVNNKLKTKSISTSAAEYAQITNVIKLKIEKSSL